jgi:hypothetical protein
MGHMHMIGKTIKVTMTPPEGKPETLLDIQDWDYNWQETYWLKQPVRSRKAPCCVEAIYDNTTKNPTTRSIRRGRSRSANRRRTRCVLSSWVGRRTTRPHPRDAAARSLSQSCSRYKPEAQRGCCVLAARLVHKPALPGPALL